jgi:hypothetical protein
VLEQAEEIFTVVSVVTDEGKKVAHPITNLTVIFCYLIDSEQKQYRLLKLCLFA